MAEEKDKKTESQKLNAEGEKKKQAPMEVSVSKEEKKLYGWTALKRPYQQKDKEFWTTVLSILGLVSLILFFVKEFFLIVALAGFVFLYYVLTTVEPESAKYKITNKGVYISTSELYKWDILKRFWISEKWGFQVLNMETWLKFPRVISLVIPKEDQEEIVELIEKYLPQEDESPQFLDKFTDWLSKKFPLESPENKS